MSRALHIIGAGGHAKFVISMAIACGYTDIEIYDDDPSKHGLEILGFTVIGGIEKSQGSASVVIAIGNNHIRQKLAEIFHARHWATLQHPSAVMDDSVFVGVGTVIGPNVVVNPDARIEAQVILNSSCVIEHDCRVGNYVHIAPNATLTGGVEVGDYSLIGAGSVILPNRVVVGNAIIGAGSVVTGHVPEGARVAGVPARLLEDPNAETSS